MHDGFRLEGSEGGSNLLEVAELALEEFRAGIDRGAMAFGKIVENGNVMPFIEKQLRANAADVAGAADDENLHRGSCRAVARDVKARNENSGFLFEARDHAADELIISARIQHLEALLFRAPLDDVDIDMAHAPLPHRGAAG